MRYTSGPTSQRVDAIFIPDELDQDLMRSRRLRWVGFFGFRTARFAEFRKRGKHFVVTIECNDGERKCGICIMC